MLARPGGGAQALGELHRAVGARGGQRDRELVAADAVGAVARALGRADRLRKRLQALVAGLVAVLVVDGLEVVEVDEHERERRRGAADALELAREVLVERAVVAQPGERVGDGDLRQALELGRARRVEPAPEAQDDQRERGEQREADAERDPDRALGPHALRAHGGAVGERARLGGAGLAGDRVLEDAEDRVDDLVVVVLDRRLVAGVDGREQRAAGGVVLRMQGEQGPDDRARRGRSVAPADVLERGREAPLRRVVREPDAVAALVAVAALLGLRLADPVPRVLVARADLQRAVGAARGRLDAALAEDREAGQEAEHERAGRRRSRARPSAP